jgi:pimeloyl-ACP methyl ester carboxylesterase
LEFVDCPGSVQCARLDVPLDWTRKHQNGGKRAAIAVVRVPAKVSIDDPRYGGSILINPGGPGGSGSLFAIGSGRIIQSIVDSTEDPEAISFNGGHKFFDVVGFDPRGVGSSTPSTSCFPDEVELNAWDQSAKAQGYPHSNETFASAWSRQVSLAQSCTWRYGDEKNEEIGRYLSTPSVVEDMVAIIEALGSWRETEYINNESNSESLEGSIVPDHIKWKKGEEKLQYWGFSYGTIVGATFASMHPDKIEKVILDGVVDAEDYYSGLKPRPIYCLSGS